MNEIDALAEKAFNGPGIKVLKERAQELAKEFRRLAAEAKERGLQAEGNYQLQRGKRLAFEQAAQMLEEKLNGA